MSVPEKRISKTRTRSRRAHHALSPIAVQLCSKCNAPILPHHACTQCGYYRGRDVLNMQAKTERRLLKKQRPTAPAAPATAPAEQSTAKA